MLQCMSRARHLARSKSRAARRCRSHRTSPNSFVAVSKLSWIARRWPSTRTRVLIEVVGDTAGGLPPPTTTWPGRAQRSWSKPKLQPNELNCRTSTAAPGAPQWPFRITSMKINPTYGASSPDGTRWTKTAAYLPGRFPAARNASIGALNQRTERPRQSCVYGRGEPSVPTSDPRSGRRVRGPTENCPHEG